MADNRRRSPPAVSRRLISSLPWPRGISSDESDHGTIVAPRASQAELAAFEKRL